MVVGRRCKNAFAVIVLLTVTKGSHARFVKSCAKRFATSAKLASYWAIFRHSKLEMEARRAAASKRASKNQLNLLLTDQARLQRLHDQLQASNSLHADRSMLEEEARRAATSKKAGEDEVNRLLANQARLQRRHDQLLADYEEQPREGNELIMSERSRLRDNLRRAKEAIKEERENPKMDKKTLAYLLSEHSRMRDHFRSLFTASEGRKTEYFNRQADYKSLRMGTLNACVCHRPAIKEPTVNSLLTRSLLAGSSKGTHKQEAKDDTPLSLVDSSGQAEPEGSGGVLPEPYTETVLCVTLGS